MRPRAGGTASQAPCRAALYLVRAVRAVSLALVRRWPEYARHPTRGVKANLVLGLTGSWSPWSCPSRCGAGAILARSMPCCGTRWR